MLTKADTVCMEKSDIRRANLRHIIDQAVAHGEAKNDTDFCIQRDLNQSYVSQVLNGKRPIGERSASNIEEKLNLRAGTLDQAIAQSNEISKHEVRIAGANFDVYDQRFNNLKWLIKIHGSQRQLADLVETNPSYISQIISKVQANGRDRTVGNDFARKIEEKLELPHGWMDSPHNENEISVESTLAKYGQQSLPIGLPVDCSVTDIPMRSIPVVSWVQAGDWTHASPIVDTEVTEWLPWYPHCGNNGFALIVSGESMLPKFEPQDRIYVNPDAQVNDLRTGDLIVVFCEEDGTATFKRLIVEPEDMHLEPLNPDFKKNKRMSLKQGCRLVGKVVGMHRHM